MHEHPLQAETPPAAGCWLVYYVRDVANPLSSLAMPGLVPPENPRSKKGKVSAQVMASWQNATDAPP